MPTVVVSRPVLWEVADVVEQIFFIAFVKDLTPTSEDRYAAACDYQAECGLSDSAMREALSSSLTTMREVRERAQVIALMRLYSRRWRVWDREGRRGRRPSRQPPKQRLRKRDCALRDAGVQKADREHSSVTRRVAECPGARSAHSVR